MKLDPTLMIAVALVAWWYLRDGETSNNSTLKIEALNPKGERIFVDPPRRAAGAVLKVPTAGATGIAAEFARNVLPKRNPNDNRTTRTPTA